MLRNRKKQLGQGMTEYIIIVALIAVAAISVYNLFGQTVRTQVGDLAAELGGGSSSGKASGLGGDAQKAATRGTTLADFEQDE
jgi:Flp pilus assembly pilin Flp